MDVFRVVMDCIIFVFFHIEHLSHSPYDNKKAGKF